METPYPLPQTPNHIQTGHILGSSTYLPIHPLSAWEYRDKHFLDLGRDE